MLTDEHRTRTDRNGLERTKSVYISWLFVQKVNSCITGGQYDKCRRYRNDRMHPFCGSACRYSRIPVVTTTRLPQDSHKVPTSLEYTHSWQCACQSGPTGSPYPIPTRGNLARSQRHNCTKKKGTCSTFEQMHWETGGRIRGSAATRASGHTRTPDSRGLGSGIDLLMRMLQIGLVQFGVDQGSFGFAVAHEGLQLLERDPAADSGRREGMTQHVRCTLDFDLGAQADALNDQLHRSR